MAERVALVTGASSGIGFAIAQVLGQAGYAITATARRAAKLQQAAGALRDAGIEVDAIAADLADEGQIAELFAVHAERHGRLDVQVNNAGVGIEGPIEGLSNEDLDKQIDVNLRALILATREGLPLLRRAGAEHGKALLVNVASIAGKRGGTGGAVYAASKAAVLNFTECSQAEVAADGVQCTALSPAWVDTPMSAPFQDAVPAATMLRPTDIAEAIKFLLSISPNCHVPEIVFQRPGMGLAA